jgi:ABC-type nitrate/sulfonate/bicarbonate transport system substrate-binding protein
MNNRPLPRPILAAMLACIVAVGAAGCGGSGEGTGSSAGDQVTIALDYAPNANYLGIYVAQAKGYFADEGVRPKILPYANTPAETLIRSGKADLAISYPPDVVINRSQGLKYKAVAALVAGNTTELVVLADSKYRRPAQLSGKLYGGFGIQSDKALITEIMKRDGASDPSFRQVVINTAALEALKSGRVDYTAIFAGIDDVQAEKMGIELRGFPYREYLGEAGNYPNAVYVAADETIDARGEVLKRTLAALAKGYEFAAANPDEAARILIEANAATLGRDRAITIATSRVASRQFLDPQTGTWGPLADTDFSGLGAILEQGGVIKGTPPAPSELYTDSLLPGQ